MDPNIPDIQCFSEESDCLILCPVLTLWPVPPRSAMPRHGFGCSSCLAGGIRAPPIIDVFQMLRSGPFCHQLGSRSTHLARRPETRPRSAVPWHGLGRLPRLAGRIRAPPIVDVFQCFGLARSATSLVSAPFAPPAVPSPVSAPLRFGLDVVVPLDWLLS